jgi:hypothetical protein
MRVFSKGLLIVFAFFISATQSVFSQTNNVLHFPKLPDETKSFLMTADEFTLLSLDPDRGAGQKAKSAFRGYRVVGSTAIVAPKEKTSLVNALENGIADGRTIAMCFNPRHGIRAKKGDQTIDCLICFECSQVVIYSNSATNSYLTDGTPQRTFNASLTIHKVALPEK